MNDDDDNDGAMMSDGESDHTDDSSESDYGCETDDDDDDDDESDDESDDELSDDATDDDDDDETEEEASMEATDDEDENDNTSDLHDDNNSEDKESPSADDVLEEDLDGAATAAKKLVQQARKRRGGGNSPKKNGGKKNKTKNNNKKNGVVLTPEQIEKRDRKEQKKLERARKQQLKKLKKEAMQLLEKKDRRKQKRLQRRLTRKTEKTNFSFLPQIASVLRGFFALNKNTAAVNSLRALHSAVFSTPENCIELIGSLGLTESTSSDGNHASSSSSSGLNRHPINVKEIVAAAHSIVSTYVHCQVDASEIENQKTASRARSGLLVTPEIKKNYRIPKAEIKKVRAQKPLAIWLAFQWISMLRLAYPRAFAATTSATNPLATVNEKMFEKKFIDAYILKKVAVFTNIPMAALRIFSSFSAIALNFHNILTVKFPMIPLTPFNCFEMIRNGIPEGKRVVPLVERSPMEVLHAHFGKPSSPLSSRSILDDVQDLQDAVPARIITSNPLQFMADKILSSTPLGSAFSAASAKVSGFVDNNNTVQSIVNNNFVKMLFRIIRGSVPDMGMLAGLNTNNNNDTHQQNFVDQCVGQASARLVKMILSLVLTRPDSLESAAEKTVERTKKVAAVVLKAAWSSVVDHASSAVAQELKREHYAEYINTAVEVGSAAVSLVQKHKSNPGVKLALEEVAKLARKLGINDRQLLPVLQPKEFVERICGYASFLIDICSVGFTFDENHPLFKSFVNKSVVGTVVDRRFVTPYLKRFLKLDKTGQFVTFKWKPSGGGYRHHSSPSSSGPANWIDIVDGTCSGSEGNNKTTYTLRYPVTTREFLRSRQKKAMMFCSLVRPHPFCLEALYIPDLLCAIATFMAEGLWKLAPIVQNEDGETSNLKDEKLKKEERKEAQKAASRIWTFLADCVRTTCPIVSDLNFSVSAKTERYMAECKTQQDYLSFLRVLSMELGKAGICHEYEMPEEPKTVKELALGFATTPEFESYAEIVCNIWFIKDPIFGSGMPIKAMRFRPDRFDEPEDEEKKMKKTKKKQTTTTATTTSPKKSNNSNDDSDDERRSSSKKKNNNNNNSKKTNAPDDELTQKKRREKDRKLRDAARNPDDVDEWGFYGKQSEERESRYGQDREKLYRVQTAYEEANALVLFPALYEDFPPQDDYSEFGEIVEQNDSLPFNTIQTFFRMHGMKELKFGDAAGGEDGETLLSEMPEISALITLMIRKTDIPRTSINRLVLKLPESAADLVRDILYLKCLGSTNFKIGKLKTLSTVFNRLGLPRSSGNNISKILEQYIVILNSKVSGYAISEAMGGGGNLYNKTLLAPARLYLAKRMMEGTSSDELLKAAAGLDQTLSATSRRRAELSLKKARSALSGVSAFKSAAGVTRKMMDNFTTGGKASTAADDVSDSDDDKEQADEDGSLRLISSDLKKMLRWFQLLIQENYLALGTCFVSHLSEKLGKVSSPFSSANNSPRNNNDDDNEDNNNNNSASRNHHNDNNSDQGFELTFMKSVLFLLYAKDDIDQSNTGRDAADEVKTAYDDSEDDSDWDDGLSEQQRAEKQKQRRERRREKKESSSSFWSDSDDDDDDDVDEEEKYALKNLRAKIKNRKRPDLAGITQSAYCRFSPMLRRILNVIMQVDENAETAANTLQNLQSRNIPGVTGLLKIVDPSLVGLLSNITQPLKALVELVDENLKDPNSIPWTAASLAICLTSRDWKTAADCFSRLFALLKGPRTLGAILTIIVRSSADALVPEKDKRAVSSDMICSFLDLIIQNLRGEIAATTVPMFKFLKLVLSGKRPTPRDIQKIIYWGTETILESMFDTDDEKDKEQLELLRELIDQAFQLQQALEHSTSANEVFEWLPQILTPAIKLIVPKQHREKSLTIIDFFGDHIVPIFKKDALSSIASRAESVSSAVADTSVDFALLMKAVEFATESALDMAANDGGAALINTINASKGEALSAGSAASDAVAAIASAEQQQKFNSLVEFQISPDISTKIMLVAQLAKGDLSSLSPFLATVGINVPDGTIRKLLTIVEMLKGMVIDRKFSVDTAMQVGANAAANAIKSKAKQLIDAMADFVFDQFDHQRKGIISFNAFQAFLVKLNLQLPAAEARAIFDLADGDNSGYIDRAEFHLALNELQTVFSQKVLDSMGLSGRNITYALVILFLNLLLFLSFILIGVQTFSDGSTFTAVTSGILPFFTSSLAKGASSVDTLLNAADRAVGDLIGVLKKV